MRELIIKTIKRIGITFILKEIYIESYLNYYRLDFIDKFSNCCSFEVFYNETDFFTKDLLLIGKGRDMVLTDTLRSNITIIGPIENYRKAGLKSPSKKELDSYLSEKMSLLTDEIMDITIGHFDVRSVEFYTVPTLMVFVHFNYKGRRMKPIKFFIGEDINYSSELDCTCLIERIKEVITK